MSRSVSIPTTRASSLSTGTHPQSWSHISWAAVARLSDMKHVLTFEVITSLIFIVVPSRRFSMFATTETSLSVRCRSISRAMSVTSRTPRQASPLSRAPSTVDNVTSMRCRFSAARSRNRRIYSYGLSSDGPTDNLRVAILDLHDEAVEPSVPAPRRTQTSHIRGALSGKRNVCAVQGARWTSGIRYVRCHDGYIWLLASARTLNERQTSPSSVASYGYMVRSSWCGRMQKERRIRHPPLNERSIGRGTYGTVAAVFPINRGSALMSSIDRILCPEISKTPLRLC